MRLLILMMQLIATVTILLLVCGTVIYFYDNLSQAYQALQLFGLHFNKLTAHQLALVTACIIGLGVLIESAPVIWHTLIHWGQVGLYMLIPPKACSLTNIKATLANIDALINQTNLTLQSLFMPEDQATFNHRSLQKLSLATKTIKDDCENMHYILQNYQSYGKVGAQQLLLVKKNLSALVSANLELCVKLNILKQNFIKKI